MPALWSAKRKAETGGASGRNAASASTLDEWGSRAIPPPSPHLWAESERRAELATAGRTKQRQRTHRAKSGERL